MRRDPAPVALDQTDSPPTSSLSSTSTAPSSSSSTRNSAQGAPETGQSAHGLRRAFLVTGAETVLAALWRVDDGTTDSLMRDFYQRVLLQL